MCTYPGPSLQWGFWSETPPPREKYQSANRYEMLRQSARSFLGGFKSVMKDSSWQTKLATHTHTSPLEILSVRHCTYQFQETIKNHVRLDLTEY